MRHLLSLIEANEPRFGGYRALVFEGRAFTNVELNARSRHLAAGLRRLGLKFQDRIALHLVNCPEVWEMYLAAYRIGAVVIPTVPSLTAGELAFILSDSAATALVTDADGAPKLPTLRAECPRLEDVILIGDAAAAGVRYSDLTRSADTIAGTPGSAADLAALIYTSGTTGKPKGVMLTHENFFSQAELTYGIYVARGEDSRRNSLLMPLPLSHIYGLSVMITTLLMGNTMVMMRRFEAGTALRLIREHAIRIVPAVPTMLIKMLAQPDASDCCTSVVQWDCGGSPLPVKVLDEIHERLGGAVTEGWGLSEATGPVANITRDIPLKKGSVGPPLPGIELRVVDASGRDVARGQPGEFLVRGATVMVGYWNRAEATERVLEGGWLHTGDIGYQDADGYCFIVDRKDDLIIHGGENISPREIEETLYQHPGVHEAVVVGKPDAVYGQRVCAYVVKRAGADASETDVLDFCRHRLARHKVPQHLHVVTELPKNPNGKILRADITRMECER